MEFGQLSYAQEGEDILLNRIFNFKQSGVFVDVGAHHPKRFSNTYLFYKMGWRGVNIDAMPGSMAAFHNIRPLDKNIECGVGLKKGQLTFYIFKEPALNTFDENQARIYKSEGWELLEEKFVDVLPLVDLLEANLESKEIDFMSIDVEGFELNILRSNNWTKFRPTFILIEDLKFSFDHLDENQVYQFLIGEGYSIFGKTVNTLLYKAL